MYTLFSLFILILSFYFFKKVSGDMRITRLNMISWIFYFDLFLQAWIASVLVINNIDNHYMIKKVSDEARLYGYLAVQYTMIALPIGMYLTTLLFGYKDVKNLLNQYLISPIIPLFSYRDSYVRIGLYILSGITILSVLYVLYVLPTIPLKSVLQGADAFILKELRVEAKNDFLGNQYIRNLFAIGLTPLVSYIAYAYYKMTNLKKDLLWFLIMFFFSFLILTYNLEKAPFLFYLIGFMFLNILIKGKIKKKTLFLFFLVVFLLLIILYIFIAKVVDPAVLFSYNSGIIGRIILSQAEGTYLTFDLFPNKVDFLGVSSISNFINSIIDIKTMPRSANILPEFFNPEKYKIGMTGVINSLFIAEAWANFGLLGVIFAPLYVGMLIQTLYLTLLKLPKTPIFLGVFTYFSYKGAINGGFNGYIYSVKPIVVLLSILMIYISGVIFKQIKKRNKLNESIIIS